MSRAVVKVVRVHYLHPGLQVDVLRGVGFRAIEGERWRGPVRSSYREALADVRERNRERRVAVAR